MILSEIERAILDVELDFNQLAKKIFDYQIENNQVYKRYCEDQLAFEGWDKVPFLPIEAFKYAPVVTFPPADAEKVFHSSGTSKMAKSKHYVRHVDLYDTSALVHFEQVFGSHQRTILAHLPHYMSAGEHSSLVHMVNQIIDRFGNEKSAFFLDDTTVLSQAIQDKEPVLLFGAAFGLLDLLDQTTVSRKSWILPKGSVILETGGMKTHRKSITRQDLHHKLASGFGIPETQVWSEYGMCELLSQCYSVGGEVFYPPAWMKFKIIDPSNPNVTLEDGSAGALAIFDCANLYSVSAIITQDKAVKMGNGFKVLGRLSQAELRGCNFLIS